MNAKIYVWYAVAQVAGPDEFTLLDRSVITGYDDEGTTFTTFEAAAEFRKEYLEDYEANCGKEFADQLKKRIVIFKETRQVVTE